MKETAIRLVLVLLAATSSAAAEVESVTLSSDLSYGYASELETSMQSLLVLRAGLDIGIDESSLLVASARVRLDADDELEPGRTPVDTYAGASRPLTLGTAGAAQIRDFYVEFVSRRGTTRLGKQQIVWGRLDGIKVLDLVNPQDFREFILEDFNESRISLWSVYFDYSFGDWRTELAVIPDGTGHAIPEPGAWFELSAPRFRYGAAPDAPAPPVVTDERTHGLGDAAIGLRLSRRLGPAELGLVAYSGTDHEPLGRLVTVNGRSVVERFYERRDAVGFSLDVGLGRAVVRAEYAYQPERAFNSRSAGQLATVELDQHRGAIGLDFDGPLGVFVNLQFLVDSISGAPSTLARPAQDKIATLYLRRTFLYDTVVLEARWYQSFTDEDRLASLSIDYAFSDSTSVTLAAQAFGGAPEGLFGQFDDRDRITLSLAHTFR